MPLRYSATLKLSYLNHFIPHPPFTLWAQGCPMSQDDDSPSYSGCTPRSSSGENSQMGRQFKYQPHAEGKQETDFSLDKELNKECTPVKASLNQSVLL